MVVFYSKLIRNRWSLAFIRESIDQILEGQPISFTYVKNPFQDKCWFADPFILDVTEEFIYLLVEEVRFDNPKGRIAKLTIDRQTMTIVNLEIILEEPWHLSFPNVLRIKERIFVYPESALGGKLFLYELLQDQNGKSELKRVRTICDDVVWDSEISTLFGDPLLFTSHSDDYHLDIYQWNEEEERFKYGLSLNSLHRKMRMAGSLFTVKDSVYCPSQISSYIYGKAVEIKKIWKTDSGWELTAIRKLSPPKGLRNDGLHTFNTYKGMIVVDYHQYDFLIGIIVRNLVILKKWLFKKH